MAKLLDIKKRSYYDVCSMIGSADKDEDSAVEREAEILAMSITESIGHGRID